MKIKEDILDYLKEIKKPATTHDIAKSIKRPWHSVHNRMLRLEMEGKVKNERLKRLHIWSLKDKDSEEGEEREKIRSILKEDGLSQIAKERRNVKEILERASHPIKKDDKKDDKKYSWTGISGLDKLLHYGIPKGNSVIIAGGTGSGKTLIALQIMNYALSNGEKCLFVTMEEREEKLIDHMKDFGYDIDKYVKNGQLMIYRINPFDLKRSIDALLAQAKGELLIDVKPVMLPTHFQPEKIFVDSLTAIAASFTGREETYRIYIEQFFRYLETTGATSFLITETDQIPTKYSPTGTEEFLADGVIVLYSIQLKKERIRAIEILKLRGAGHERKIVLFDIKDGKGIEVYPYKEIFVDL